MCRTYMIQYPEAVTVSKIWKQDRYLVETAQKEGRNSPETKIVPDGDGRTTTNPITKRSRA